MKKILCICLIIVTFCLLVACDNGVSNSGDKTDNYPSGSNENAKVEATSISIDCGNQFWTVDYRTKIYIKSTPSYADTSSVEYTSSDSDIARISGDYIYFNGVAGDVVITAKLKNGVSSTKKIIIKEFCTIEYPDLPLKIQTGFSSSSYRIYTISDISYSWYVYSDYSSEKYGEYADKLSVTLSGMKNYDTYGATNTMTDELVVINLYDKNGYQVDTTKVFVTSLLSGDPFKVKEKLLYATKDKAPFKIKIVKAL